jgi:hypothetical protein
MESQESPEREPDYTDDPRERDVSDQLPEEQEEGATDGNEAKDHNGRTPEPGGPDAA